MKTNRNKDWPYWAMVVFVAMVALWHANNAEAETALYAGAWSDHPFSNHEYNEDHRLIAFEHNQVFAGYFRNSYGEDSFATGYRFKRAYGDWEVGLLAGASYGYRSCIKGWEDQPRRYCPLIAPMVSYTKHRLQPTLVIMGPAVALSFRIEL